MSETQTESVSETQVVTAVEETAATQEAPQERMVPLKALEEERRKRQESEARSRILTELSDRRERAEETVDDGEDWVTKSDQKQQFVNVKREILEDAYAQGNPKAIEQIEKYLPDLMNTKPWVRSAVENSSNRLSAAYDIVQEVILSKQKSDGSADAKRMIDNANKPGSAAIVGKGVGMSRAETIRKAIGTSEWGAVREKIRNGEL